MSKIAVYHNKEYSATVYLSKGYAVLCADLDEMCEDGFEYRNGRYYKRVDISELDAAYSVERYIDIGGMKGQVIGETEDDYIVVFDNLLPSEAIGYGVSHVAEPGMYRERISKKDVQIEIRKELIYPKKKENLSND